MKPKGDIVEGECYQEDGKIYRKGMKGGGRISVEQLVLPGKCIEMVMGIGHIIPLAGHLGRRKRLKMILQRLWWPGISKDVGVFCKACSKCQLTSSRKVCPVPLMPLPVMEVPFQRIGMDVVGPLPRSRTGNRFVLVVVDYAKRYPEAIPLRTVDPEQVAEALRAFFSSVGIPVEILTDQVSNFMSKLLKEVYHLMVVKPICTSPYHPQTDGLVERFNQTLKAMLRKSAEEGKDWDKLLPYVLFVYRKVPQETTGFFPFELLYGREVRGPLDVIRETWEADLSSGESIVSYVVRMRERLEAMAELVKENVGKAQRHQKEWFDRQARAREMKVGEKVLYALTY